MVISPIPIVATLCLIVFVAESYLTAKNDSVIKRLDVTSSGVLKLNKSSENCRSVSMLFKPIMVQIITENGKRINVWRDACPEKDYRKLLVILRFLIEKKKE